MSPQRVAHRPCPDCRRDEPCALCLAHGTDLSTVMVAPGVPVYVRNDGNQERVQRALLWLFDRTLLEYDRSVTR